MKLHNQSFKEILFLFLLSQAINSFAFAKVELSQKESAQFQNQLREACVKRSEDLKRNDDDSFCRCFARNHVIVAKLEGENDKTTFRNQIDWLVKAAKSQLPEKEVRKDPYFLLGSAGWIEGIDKKCKENSKFTVDEKDPRIDP